MGGCGKLDCVWINKDVNHIYWGVNKTYTISPCLTCSRAKREFYTKDNYLKREEVTEEESFIDRIIKKVDGCLKEDK